MGELRKAAASVLHATSADVEMQGAGRTDAGVHALGQVAHVKVDRQVRETPEELLRRFNDLLPADIVVSEGRARGTEFSRAARCRLAQLHLSDFTRESRHSRKRPCGG